MEVSEDFTITLRLGQQPLSITIRREDEEAYRAAEKLINQRYNSYAPSIRIRAMKFICAWRR